MKVFGDHSTPQSPTHRELVEFSPAYASAVAAHLSALAALDAYLDGAIYGGPGWALRKAVLDTGKAVDTARAEATDEFLRSI